MKLGITGADGLIGWHIRAFAKAHRPDVTVHLATRTTFADAALLQHFVDGCDAIIHCAGVNRGTDDEKPDLRLRFRAKGSHRAVSASRRPNLWPHWRSRRTRMCRTAIRYGRR